MVMPEDENATPLGIMIIIVEIQANVHGIFFMLS